jgi:hypothetical protein
MRMYGDMGSTYRAFVGDCWPLNVPCISSEYCGTRELLTSPEMLEAYARVCAALLKMKAHGHKSVAAPVPLAEVDMGRMDTVMWLVVFQGARAMVEFERRRLTLEEEWRV